MSSASSSKSYTEALDTTRAGFDDLGRATKLDTPLACRAWQKSEGTSPLLQRPPDEDLRGLFTVLSQFQNSRRRMECIGIPSARARRVQARPCAARARAVCTPGRRCPLSCSTQRWGVADRRDEADIEYGQRLCDAVDIRMPAHFDLVHGGQRQARLADFLEVLRAAVSTLSERKEIMSGALTSWTLRRS